MRKPLKIHREGRKVLALLFLGLAVMVGIVAWRAPVQLPVVGIAAGLFFLVVLQFFRNPTRMVPEEADHLVYAPADGKVVVIEEAYEQEYFNEKRLQVSIFMSPVNVHVNRNPVGGLVKYNKYHPGKYLVAWHPKSSSENERTTVVIDTGEEEILLRQIAGALAKRIKNYLEVGQQVTQGEDFGFIKFGSRVDVFLPLDAEIKVDIGQKVKGNKTVIAHI